MEQPLFLDPEIGVDLDMLAYHINGAVYKAKANLKRIAQYFRRLSQNRQSRTKTIDQQTCYSKSMPYLKHLKLEPDSGEFGFMYGTTYGANGIHTFSRFLVKKIIIGDRLEFYVSGVLLFKDLANV